MTETEQLRDSRLPRQTMPTPRPGETARTYWNGFYSTLDLPPERTPPPSPLLVAELAGRAPGTALDLGCGAGGDAIWLARSGWRVTAVDVSDVVLRSASSYAARAGVEEWIDWQRHDLTETFPPGGFDLVSTQFLHSPVERPGDRNEILRTAMSAVRPGGSLIVIGHLGDPSRAGRPAFDVHLPSAAEVLATLAPDLRTWSVVTEQTLTREVSDADGRPMTFHDTVLHLLRSSE